MNQGYNRLMVLLEMGEFFGKSTSQQLRLQLRQFDGHGVKTGF